MKLFGVFVIGLMVGLAVAVSVVRFVIYPQVAKEKFEFGEMQGEINAQSEIARKVDALLGNDFDRYEPVEPFYGVKQTAVVIVTRNGVKTLRACCDETPQSSKQPDGDLTPM